MFNEQENYYNGDEDFCYNGQVYEATPWNDMYYVYVPTSKVYDDPEDPRNDIPVKSRVSKAAYMAALLAVKAELGIED